MAIVMSASHIAVRHTRKRDHPIIGGDALVSAESDFAAGPRIGLVKSTAQPWQDTKTWPGYAPAACAGHVCALFKVGLAPGQPGNHTARCRCPVRSSSETRIGGHRRHPASSRCAGRARLRLAALAELLRFLQCKIQTNPGTIRSPRRTCRISPMGWAAFA